MARQWRAEQSWSEPIITRLFRYWEIIRASLWPVPLLMTLAACGLAYAALTIDVGIGQSVWFIFSGSGKQAPDFLSSLMTAMITMATLAISITMVVLTLAAQQLGPRLIRNFMQNRRTQFALGLFVGTVVYLILVLRDAYGARGSVPNLAVTGGTFLVLISVITLLLFLHHLARSIVADNVIADVGDELDFNIKRLLSNENEGTLFEMKGNTVQVTLASDGFVQVIDYDTIALSAAETNATVVLTLRAGQHSISDSVVALISPPENATDRLRRAIRDSIVLGRERTAVQDLEYSIRQLVEIALRGLSPGINDVFTALAVIDRLTSSIAKIMKRGTEKSVWRDKDGTVRLSAPVSTFEGIVDASFNQIRQNCAGKPAVMIHLVDDLGQLLRQAEEPHREALEKHVRLVLEVGRRTITEQYDLRVLEARAHAARKEALAGMKTGVAAVSFSSAHPA